jgi:uncharacterized protein YceK
MRKGRLKALLGYAALSWLCWEPGCSSVITQVMYWQGEIDESFKPVMVYIGTRGDIGFIAEGSFTHPGPCTPSALLGIVDLPFSLCMDTALLPLTIPESIAGAVGRGCGPTAGRPSPSSVPRGPGASSAPPACPERMPLSWAAAKPTLSSPPTAAGWRADEIAAIWNALPVPAADRPWLDPATEEKLDLAINDRFRANDFTGALSAIEAWRAAWLQLLRPAPTPPEGDREDWLPVESEVLGGEVSVFVANELTPVPEPYAGAVRYTRRARAAPGLGCGRVARRPCRQEGSGWPGSWRA